MQQRDAKADLANLERISREITRLQGEATDILAAGDDRAAVALSQFGTLNQTLIDYIPHARDVAMGADERRQEVTDYVRKRYSAKRD